MGTYKPTWREVAEGTEWRRGGRYRRKWDVEHDGEYFLDRMERGERLPRLHLTLEVLLLRHIVLD